LLSESYNALALSGSLIRIIILVLYPVANFEDIEERRREYGIEPFRWPKSLAMPKEEQPWLKRPLSELVMREPT